MADWLMKSEPGSYGIADLERDGTTGWEGVRNFQARNAMRAMRVGDRVLFYHSNAKPSGVAGTAVVSREAYPDPTQFDSDSSYRDPTSDLADPRWSAVQIGFVERFPEVVGLAALKADPALAGLEVARKGSRLSVLPVNAAHFDHIVAGGRGHGQVRRP
ncbi:MAG: EVE domain-containing protein [Deltaproteobacteria bacterium]|nr:EVE domain-containing protein [Deltaproteobacteria bacterium]